MNHQPRSTRATQSGGITILVVLSMLVLMTVIAVGMSRNSLREVFIVGSSQQAAVVRQTADTGLEYSIVWMKADKVPTDTGAIKFKEVQGLLVHNTESAGLSTPIAPVGATDMQMPAPTGQSRSFTLKMMRMGKVEPDMVSGGVVDTRSWNDLWIVQSSGRTVLGATTFQHDKEVWVTTPAVVD